jgi:hypothetical protein
MIPSLDKERVRTGRMCHSHARLQICIQIDNGFYVCHYTVLPLRECVISSQIKLTISLLPQAKAFTYRQMLMLCKDVLDDADANALNCILQGILTS